MSCEFPTFAQMTYWLPPAVTLLLLGVECETASSYPSGCYGAEFTAFAIEVSFLKNGTTTMVRIFGMEGVLNF